MSRCNAPPDTTALMWSAVSTFLFKLALSVAAGLVKLCADMRYSSAQRHNGAECTHVGGDSLLLSWCFEKLVILRAMPFLTFTPGMQCEQCVSSMGDNYGTLYIRTRCKPLPTLPTVTNAGLCPQLRPLLVASPLLPAARWSSAWLPCRLRRPPD